MTKKALRGRKKAMFEALDIKAPNQQIQSKGLTKEQRMEVEDLIETKIEQAKRGY